jgi:aminopeptidase N
MPPRPTGAYRAGYSEEAGRRALRNLCLGYLLELDTLPPRQLALQQFETRGQHDRPVRRAFGAGQRQCPGPASGIARWPPSIQRWQHEALVVDKWLAVQSTSRRPDTLATVKA